MDNSQYDPYVPKAGSSGRVGADPAGGMRGNDNINRAQLAVDEATGVMRENIIKVTERGERMDDLKNKTDDLAIASQQFSRNANKVRKNYWWKDFKMRIIIGVAIVIILIIIIVPIVKAVKN